MNIVGTVEVARSVYPNTAHNISGVVSTLVYGVQWDATLQWWLDVKAKDINGNIIDVNNSTTYGNYLDHEIKAEDLNEVSAYAILTNLDDDDAYEVDSWQMATSTSNKPENTAWVLSTGALKAAKVNNIYDMAGNILEWTMESANDREKVLRGGCFGYSGVKPSLDNYFTSMAASTPVSIALNSQSDSIGFRIALYIKK